ncbi:BING4CT domain-containing protein [Ditylenchus destructor]|uniref:BING4CT domain-containing protein n=1 Tax=Ditylenchus destructor TaxID=166010 RepID=A0AAD4RC98_9BILA|nr:BING4CT domain-containing protein [Ditylenchus destructor]
MGKVKENFDDAGALKLKPENAKTKITRERLAKKKKRFVERGEKLGRAKILTHEEPGGIEMKEKNIPTTSITQADIREAVDVVSATKSFELTLDKFGPYRINYTRNGRYILLGGKRGHIAAFDWMTKELKHETNVMETVRDVQWLHVNTMYAVAQKRWLRIYDHNGTELHCMKQLYDVVRLDFLPHHMLLVASSNNSFLHYLDISTGNIVSSFPTKHGKLDVLSHNPTNAIVLTGSAKGVVSMWSPNSKQPLVELFAHKAPVRGIAVDESGTYMATTGLDRRLRIWDIRNYKQLQAYSMASCFGEVAFSQRRHVAAATGRIVQVFKDAHLGQSRTPYMQHLCPSVVSDLQFCPYEDVLGVAYQNGFSSLLIPGSGDPNFDALKENPFESKKQRQEREVKMLLEKIQPELITLDPADINKVNRANVERTLEYKTSVLRIKPDDINRD